MTEKQIIIAWININYKVFTANKSKKTFLILHWWGGKSDSWIEVWDKLEEEWYTVIIPDLPGFWKTKLNKVFTLEDYSKIIHRFSTELELKDIILIWHSNWWAISIKLVNSKENNIKKLILNNSAWIRNNKKRSLKRKILNKVTTIIKKIPFIKKEKLKFLRKSFYKLIWWQDYLKSEETPFLKETYQNMISSDLQEEMRHINLNTSLIRWENDTYTPLSDWKKINSLIKKSNITILDNEKHWIHLQNPDRLVKTILKNI